MKFPAIGHRMMSEFENIDTVILANGVFPRHKIPLGVLRKANLIVCCDGAVGKLVNHGFIPGIIAGDLDSLSKELKNRFKDILFHDPDQETNDLTKAVNWCISNRKQGMIILGATGLREDHTLGNISLLAEYCKRTKAIILTDNGVFEAFNGSVTLDSFPGQQVSAFSVNSATAVTSTGLRYPLHKLVLDNWWKGTLNEATGEKFTLDFSGGPLIVFRRY